jgi:hypothetical protein
MESRLGLGAVTADAMTRERHGAQETTGVMLQIGKPMRATGT